MTFVKGQSGNPGGRRKKYITELIEQIGKEIEPKTGKPFEGLIARRLWIAAVNGNGDAIKEILNRVEGLPHQSLELSGDEESPIKIDIISTLKKIYGSRSKKSSGGMLNGSV